MRIKSNNLSGDKKLGGRHGEIVEKEEKIVRLLGREVCVVVFAYKSGLKRASCYFIDSDNTTLRRRNSELTRLVYELKEKLKFYDNENK